MSTMTTASRDNEVTLTRVGYERLRDNLATLTTTDRSELRDRLRNAREQGGDLADNLELIDALEDQEVLERRIARLEASLASARVIDDAPHDGTIGIGTRVRIRDIDNGRTAEYDVVGSLEADPGQRRLSADSPVGRALLGRRTGDVLQVNAPRGRMQFRILAARRGRRSEGRTTAAGRRVRARELNGIRRGALAAAR
jgi:transcription elongation factor GreA